MCANMKTDEERDARYYAMMKELTPTHRDIVVGLLAKFWRQDFDEGVDRARWEAMENEWY